LAFEVLRPPERCGVEAGVADRGVGAPGQQQPGQLDQPVAGGGVQRRLPRPVRQQVAPTEPVDVESDVEQQFDRRRTVGRDRVDDERRPPLLRRIEALGIGGDDRTDSVGVAGGEQRDELVDRVQIGRRCTGRVRQAGETEDSSPGSACGPSSPGARSAR
jgi:hypothetical protein